jgi:hypothetical protein
MIMIQRAVRMGRLIAVLVLGLAVVAGAQTVKFEQIVQAGDVIEFDSKMQMQLSFDVSAQGQVLQKVDQKVNHVRGGQIEILEARDGLPTKVRATFSPASGGSMEMMGQAQQMPFALAGQTVTVSKGQIGEVVIDHQGNLDDSTTQELKQLLERDESMFPDRPLQVGEEFAVGNESLRKAFSIDETGQASARGKVLEVRQANGRQQARVSISGDIKTKVEGMIDMSMQLAGEGWFDVKTSKMLDGTLQGPLRISGQTAQPMQPGAPPMQLQFAGGGQFSYTERSAVNRQGGAAPGPVGGGGLGGGQAPAGGPNPFDALVPGPAGPMLAGKYSGDGMTLEMGDQNGAYAGTIRMGGQAAQFQGLRPGAGPMAGKFSIGPNSFDFTLEATAPDTLMFKTGRSSYTLKKEAAGNPFER